MIRHLYARFEPICTGRMHCTILYFTEERYERIVELLLFCIE